VDGIFYFFFFFYFLKNYKFINADKHCDTNEEPREGGSDCRRTELAHKVLSEIINLTFSIPKSDKIDKYR